MHFARTAELPADLLSEANQLTRTAKRAERRASTEVCQSSVDHAFARLCATPPSRSSCLVPSFVALPRIFFRIGEYLQRPEFGWEVRVHTVEKPRMGMSGTALSVEERENVHFLLPQRDLLR